jgi:hypothetical protein
MSGTKRERSSGVWELTVHLGRHPGTRKRVDGSRTFRGGERAAGQALAHRKRRQGQWLELDRGRIQPTDHLWLDKDLRPLQPDWVTYRWRVLADQASLDGVRHASPAMTLDVYAGRDLDADRAAAMRLGQLLDG